MTERRDGRDDGAVGGVRTEPGDEAPVDLEGVDREAFEVAERGVAGAEVVDRQPYADVFQAAQHHRRPSTSSMSTDSVISKLNWLGSMPAVAMAPRTFPTRSGDVS